MKRQTANTVSPVLPARDSRFLHRAQRDGKTRGDRGHVLGRFRSISLAAALSLLSGTVLVVLVPTMTTPAHAQAARTFTWTGNSGTAWETNGNWDSNLYADSPTTAVSFLTGVANALALLGSDHSVYGISFDYNAVKTATSFTISGSGSDNALNIYGGGITNATALTQTIDAAISLRASQSFTTVLGGTLSFTAGTYKQIDLLGNTLTVGGAGNTNIGSYIIDSSGSGGNLVKNGTGTLTLRRANDYTGTTTINGGTLNVGSASTNSSLGAGTGSVVCKGILNFNNVSTAGSASIDNYLVLNFNVLSNAGSAAITNNFNLFFHDSSSANGSTITNGSFIQFDGSSTAGSAVINNSANLNFDNSSSAGSATINNSNGSILFKDSSNAGNATIRNISGLGFNDSSTADNATIYNDSGATLDIRLHSGALSIGRLSGAGSVSLGSNALTIGGLNTSDTISGAIEGSGGSLIKSGVGTLTLTGANTYTGGTTISGGFLNVGSSASTLPGGASNTSSSLGSATGSIVNNGGLTLYDGSTLFNPATTGAGIVTNNGTISFYDSASTGAATITNTATPNGQLPHVLNFFNTSTADNATIVNGSGSFVNLGSHSGGIRIGALSGAGTIFLPKAALTIGGLNTSTTISGEIRDGSSQGGGSLIKASTGSLTLSGANTYTGGTSINGGTLSIGADSNLGTGGLTLNGGLLQWTGGSETFGRTISMGSGMGSGFDITASGTNLTVGSPLTGSGGLVKTGAGTLTLTGANTYTGATTVGYGGILNVGDNAATLSSRLGSGTGSVTNNGGLYFHYQSSAGSAQITNNQGMVFYDSTTAGTATITNNSYLYFLDNSVGNTARIINNANSGNGHLDLSGYIGAGGPRLGNVSGDGIVQLGSKTVTIGSLNASSTISGAIQDGGYNGGTGGKIVKTGTGTLTLTGANTYTGGTTVSQGMLAARGTALGAGNVTVTSGATLAVGEAPNTSLIPQATGTLTLSSLSVTLGSTTPILTFNLGNSGVSDKLLMTSATKPLSFSSAVSGNSSDFVIGFSSTTGSSLQAGTYTLFSFATAQAQGTLPLLSSYKARPAGNLGSLVTDSSAFGYVTDSNGQVTGLAFTIAEGSVAPEPGALALIVFVLPMSVGMLIRRRRQE